MKKLLVLFVMLSAVLLPQRSAALTRWTFDAKANLVKTADQLSVNAIQIMDGCSLANLLDKDGDTWFHSAWTTDNGSPLPDADHYLQVHLTEAKQHLIFTYIGMNWPSAHNSPQEVTIYVTNTPDDETSWTTLTKLTGMIPVDNYPVSYTSPHLDLGAPYTDIRLEVNQTTTGKVEGTYRRHYFCLAEFGMFEAVEEEVNNLVQTADQLSTNSIEIMDGCSLANLLDGNGDTWYHSAWNTYNDSPLPDADHYLQAHLLEPVEDFFFTFTGMNWASAHNSPDEVTIYATNTPDDESSWKEIETLTDMISGDPIPSEYTSPAIHLGAPYSDLRFVVRQTTTGAVEGTYNRHYFCLAEFGIYLGEPKQAEPINLVFIGNSITYGAMLQNPGSQAPPFKVGRMMQEELERPVTVYNCGVSGATTLDFLPATGSYFASVASAVKRAQANGGPIIFSMMLGTNDSAETGPNGSPVSPENYYKNMKVIIDYLLNNYPHTIIIVNYPIWYSPNTHNGARYLQAGLDRLQTYHPEIDRLVSFYAKMQDHQRVFAGNPETFSYFEDKTDLFVAEAGNSGTFYLHPNATGGTRLAEFWKQSIIDHLADTDFSSPRDYAPDLINEAIDVVNQCFSTTTQSSTYLLNDPGQLSTNAYEAATGTLDLLLDRKTGTWFQTDTTTRTLDEAHYLQFDLLTDTIQRVALRMIRRAAVSGKHTDNHLPNDITVYAANDTVAGPWTRVCRLNTGFPAQNQMAIYVSPSINLLQPSRYVRMVVNGNVSGATTATGWPFFSLAEVQMYPVAVNEDKSPYYTRNNGIDRACDILQALCREALQKWERDEFNEVDSLTLCQATELVRELLAQPDISRADVNRDGAIDSADIVAVIKEMPDGDMKADVNRDGAIDSADIVAVIKEMK